jgi:hypothetical protein
MEKRTPLMLYFVAESHVTNVQKRKKIQNFYVKKVRLKVRKSYKSDTRRR